MIEDDIIYVEEFVRSELHGLPEAAKTHFFGPFSSDINSFKFDEKDRMLIFELVEVLKTSNMKYEDSVCERSIMQKHASIQDWFCDDIDTKSDCLMTHKQEIKAPAGAQNLLKKMLIAAEKNSMRSKQGYRYGNDIKRLAVYNRILAGPMAFKSLQLNLDGCFPSISTTNRYIHRSDHAIIEGDLRIDELLVYLKERKQELFVIISEDATRVDNKIHYDARTNQLIGYVTNKQTKWYAHSIFL